MGFFSKPFTINARIPAYFYFSEADDGKSLEAKGIPSGLILQVDLPFYRLGVGYEYYETQIVSETESGIIRYLIDIYFVLPTPLGLMAIGGGFGGSKITGDLEDSYQSSFCSQYFVDYRIPFSSSLGFNVGLHYLYSNIEPVSGDLLLETGGYMLSAGFHIKL